MEPISTGIAAPAVGNQIITVGTLMSAVLGFVFSVDYSIVFGAFAGAVCFVVTAPGLTRWQVIGYFIFSYAVGVLGAGFTADKVEIYFNYREKPLDGLMAALISCAAVFLFWYLKDGGLARLPIIKKWVGSDDNANTDSK